MVSNDGVSSGPLGGRSEVTDGPEPKGSAHPAGPLLRRRLGATAAATPEQRGGDEQMQGPGGFPGVSQTPL